MSAYFEDQKFGDKNFASLRTSGLDSSTERTSDSSSSDESEDTEDTKPCSTNTSGSSWNVRDRNNNRKQYGIKMNLKLPSIQELTINSNSEDEAMPRLENLALDSDRESLPTNKIAELSLIDDHKPLAGVVTSVAKMIGLIVVKPPTPHEVLLYLGSPVFVRKSRTASVSKKVKLGWIIDVFGPACEPYYCVKPVNNGIELVRDGTKLFYSPDHPRTAFLSVKRDDNDRYTVLCSQRLPSLRDLRKVSRHPGDEDSWNKTSRGKLTHRQLNRRWYEGDNQGTTAYRNKYRDDPYAFHRIKPKHSYFDY